jgi:Xaa-Pro aminopeptidase
VSGREYQPSEEVMGLTNLVTVDLSPSCSGVWGDCARSFFFEDGECVDVPMNPEFVRGAQVQRELHASVLAFATPATTFHELSEFANALIKSSGFENLDFLGNIGHSIELTPADRRYIEAGNEQRLGNVRLFTFEPHIRTVGGAWGFKHENIYYFSGNEVLER